MKRIVLLLIKTLIVLIILAGVGYGIYFLFVRLVVWFGGLQKEVAAGILAALTAVTVSILSLILTKHLEVKAAIRREHREKKIPIYERFTKFWFEVLMADKAGKMPPSEQDIVLFLQQFTQELIVWGSDSVLKSFTRFREQLILRKENDPPINSMFLFENYLLEVRKDLGHKNRDINPGDILALFINDIRNYTPPKK